MTQLRFDGRVAVITGGGRGLGRAYALLLAARGARVVVNDCGGTIFGEATSESPAHEVVAQIRAAGGEAVACTQSVASPEGGAAIIAQAIDSFGRLDILIHNAGITRRAAFKDISVQDFRDVLDVHLMGAFHVARPAFPLMCAAGYGRIVLTSSIGGLYGERNISAYCTAKGGLIGLANALALEGADEGVTCNLIVPAALTRMAEGRDTSAFPPMTPGQVAPAVAWLCHESCPVTGEMLVALAGRVARAFVSETPGVYRPEWSIEEIAAAMPAIRDASAPIVFPPFPSGFADHLAYSFARSAKA